MNRIKLLAVALMLLLAGVVYAAGNAQNTVGTSCGMDNKAACCADCCKDEKSCCKSHQMGHPQKAGQAGQENKETGCANCECCKGEKSCCKADKTGKADACCMSKEGAGCCASDAGCCGESCKMKEKAKTS